jgi:Ca2+-binding RTX toxin-like protein
MAGTVPAANLAGSSTASTGLGLSGATSVTAAAARIQTFVRVIDGTTGDDRLSGGLGYDTINGFTGNDALYGGMGNDLLKGGKGADILDGGSGNNVLEGGNGSDRLIVNADGVESLDGGNGIDTAVITRSNYIFRNADGSVTVQRDSSGTRRAIIRNVEFFEVAGVTYRINELPSSVISSGTDGNDLTRGSVFGDWIRGRAGDDAIFGGPGTDYIYGEAGNDFLVGGAGGDVIVGDAGNDTINGGLGDDYLEGSTGNDVLNGGAGRDILSGGTGNDILNGGEGSDLYRISGSISNSANPISEFTSTVRPDGGIDITRNSTGEVDTLYNVEEVSLGRFQYEIAMNQGNVIFSVISRDPVREPPPNQTTPGNRVW